MNKRVFRFLIVLMSVSLIGIIFVQGYWIKNSFENSEEQFSISAKQVLLNVVRKIENEEFDKYYFEVAAMANSADPYETKLSELFHVKDKDESSEYYVYSNSILQEDFKVLSPFLYGDKDSIEFSKLINRKVTRVVRKEGLDHHQTSAMDRLVQIQKMDREERNLMRDAIQEGASMIPIHQRVDSLYLRKLIEEQVKQRNLTSDFEFGIYSNNLPTKIRSQNFVLNGASTYGASILRTKNNKDNYQLFVNFTDKKKEIITSISSISIISIIFTIIIILAFSTAINQLFRQRQISEIKTDFINNMTHEFKTPIATINLALDSLNNPKVGGNKEMHDRYLKMIRDENKRMHAQVENVLRISKLERNELNIDKDRLKLHDLLDTAIGHVNLIVQNRNGYIKKHLDANKSSILANETHFTNVIVNILDNAIKYSPEEPKIDIFTENVKNFVILKISDQGAGMSAAVQKKIFDKFYREHTGDVHNVKGHGLGLAYAKRIVNDHHGEITVQSEKGVGSSFIIKLPLIS